MSDWIFGAVLIGLLVVIVWDLAQGPIDDGTWWG